MLVCCTKSGPAYMPVMFHSLGGRFVPGSAQVQEHFNVVCGLSPAVPRGHVDETVPKIERIVCRVSDLVTGGIQNVDVRAEPSFVACVGLSSGVRGRIAKPNVNTWERRSADTFQTKVTETECV